MLHRCPSSVWLPRRRCCLAVFSKPLTSFMSRKGCCRSVKLRRKGTCRPSRRAQALAVLSILVCASPRSYAVVSAASICCFPDDQMYHRSIPACRHPAESSSPPSLLGSSLWIHSRWTLLWRSPLSCSWLASSWPVGHCRQTRRSIMACVLLAWWCKDDVVMTSHRFMAVFLYRNKSRNTKKIHLLVLVIFSSF